MTFSEYVNLIVQIVSDVCGWLLEVSKSLMQNYIFMSFLFVVIIAFVVNIIYKIYKKSKNKLMNEEEEDDNIAEVDDTEDMDTSFFDDDWEDDDFD